MAPVNKIKDKRHEDSIAQALALVNNDAQKAFGPRTEVYLESYNAGAHFFPNIRFVKHQSIFIPDKLLHALKITKTTFQLNVVGLSGNKYAFVCEYIKKYEKIPEFLCRITTQLDSDTYSKMMILRKAASLSWHYCYLMSVEMCTFPFDYKIPFPMDLNEYDGIVASNYYGFDNDQIGDEWALKFENTEIETYIK